jgi:uncharacterized protein (TIGR03437 family)
MSCVSLLKVAIVALIVPFAAQTQPGRIVTGTGSTIIECNVDGSNCFTVAGNYDNNSSQNPSVASNGTIAFTSIIDVDGTYLGYPHIFLMNADGTNIRHITPSFPGPGSNCCYGLSPTISPDGTTVAFLAALNMARDGSRPQEVYLVNADGSNLRQLTSFMANQSGDYSQSYMFGLAWSPDSKKLAFRGAVVSSQCGTYGGAPIYVNVVGSIQADGAGMQILTCDNNDGYQGSLDWSPDGTLIVFGRNVNHGAQGCSGCVGEPAIAFLDLSGQKRYSTGITSTQLGTDSCGGPHCIHFSPDNRRLAYLDQYPNRGNPCTNCLVSFIDLDGSGQTNTNIPTSSSGLWWTPGVAIPAPAQLTLAGTNLDVPPNPVEVWPGFSEQIISTLSDSTSSLILHTAATYAEDHYFYASNCLNVGPYGLAVYNSSGDGYGTIAAMNAGLTSNTLSFKCYASPPCTFALDSVGAKFLSSGGSGSVIVSTDPGSTASSCPWNARSNATWITLTAGANGSGNSSLSFNVGANSGPPRQGTISIAGQTYSVSQDGTGPGSPVVQAIADAWNYVPGLAPGEWVTITGTGLAAGAPTTWNLTGVQELPTNLGGVSVFFNGTRAALFYVSSTQIDALVPATVAPGPAQVIVELNRVDSVPFTVAATATLPSIYALPNASGSIFFVTAALAGTATLIGNASVDPRVARAAQSGDALDLYMIGLGGTNDPSKFLTDQVFSGAYPVSATIAASVGGKPAQVLFAGLTSPGLYLVRIVVPGDLTAGPQPIQISTGTYQTHSSLVLTIQ